MLSEAKLILLSTHNVVLNFACMCNIFICARLSGDTCPFDYRKTNSHLEKQHGFN